MQLISYNVNGIRAAIKKGFGDWLATHPADVICLQECKANKEDIDHAHFEKAGYETFWFPAQKKGYSGVAILTRKKPDAVFFGNGIEQSDFEGRVIRADFDDITIINAYYPSGTSGEERQTYKYQWLNEFKDYLAIVKKERSQIVVAGDYNIAHQAIDIHDPKGNKKSSGFLPEERNWMDQLLANDWVDSFRHKHPETVGAYSWWSQRFPSVRLQNKGWRIDYLCTTSSLTEKIKMAGILPDIKHSDHCPIILELKK
jgi:exodeoxyribonuclease-3